MTTIAHATAGVDDGHSKPVVLVRHLERSAKKSSGASSFSSFSVSSEKRTKRAFSGTPRPAAHPEALSPSSPSPPPSPAPTQLDEEGERQGVQRVTTRERRNTTSARARRRLETPLHPPLHELVGVQPSCPVRPLSP